MSMDWKANERRGDGTEGDRKRVSPSLVIGLVALVLAIIFIAQNTDSHPVTFLFWDGDTSTWVVIVIAMILGALIDRIGTWAWHRRRARREAN
jgi:uncharacterized integral membrane protein